MTRSPGRFLDRHRFAGEHRFVDRAAARDDDAVHRESLAWPDDDDDRLAGHPPMAHVDFAPSRRTRAVDGCSRASCRRAPAWFAAWRALPCALPEQHQRDDQDDRFVIHVRLGRRLGARTAGATVASTEYRKAAPVPTAMSVFMLRCDAGAPSTRERRNGGPPTPSRTVVGDEQADHQRAGSIAYSHGALRAPADRLRASSGDQRIAGMRDTPRPSAASRLSIAIAPSTRLTTAFDAAS